MKTKIMLFALVATFALTLFSSCSGGDCFEDLCPKEKTTKTDSTNQSQPVQN